MRGRLSIGSVREIYAAQAITSGLARSACRMCIAPASCVPTTACCTRLAMSDSTTPFSRPSSVLNASACPAAMALPSWRKATFSLSAFLFCGIWLNATADRGFGTACNVTLTSSALSGQSPLSSSLIESTAVPGLSVSAMSARIASLSMRLCLAGTMKRNMPPTLSGVRLIASRCRSGVGTSGIWTGELVALPQLASLAAAGQIDFGACAFPPVC
mmetsp:Transcript_29888/g.68904  ORF Transcript_29888/g.68904 Transcript_29888/m.68904 type:complete len:215 (-) Transcript_29888:468-1112(-)